LWCFSLPDRDEYLANQQEERKTRNTVTKEQLDLGEFIKLLVVLQSKGKITGLQFREYLDKWTKQPGEREAPTQLPKKLLNI
jgi:hypothetical protein